MLRNAEKKTATEETRYNVHQFKCALCDNIILKSEILYSRVGRVCKVLQIKNFELVDNGSGLDDEWKKNFLSILRKRYSVNMTLGLHCDCDQFESDLAFISNDIMFQFCNCLCETLKRKEEHE